MCIPSGVGHSAQCVGSSSLGTGTMLMVARLVGVMPEQVWSAQLGMCREERLLRLQTFTYLPTAILAQASFEP